MQAVSAARHTAQPMTLRDAVWREGRLATDWPCVALPIPLAWKPCIKAASHYPLALLLPVSLPVAIECQPTRALDVGAVIAVAWQRQ